MIGLDTSHVSAFAQILNDPTASHYVPGGRVVVAYPGGSDDFELSYSRVPGYTRELKEQYGVKLVKSPEEVAAQVDLVMITSLDGRVHLKQFQQTLHHKRPTFVDKPLATSVEEAQQILDLGHHLPVMSCSALRFADPLVNALQASKEDVIGCDICGLIAEEPTQRDLFFYAIHSVEVVVTIMGTGCCEVRAARSDQGDLITLIYSDGRLASIRGHRQGESRFWATIHRPEDNVTLLDLDQDETARPRYVGLLEAILQSLPHGHSAVPAAETLEVIRILDAAVKSRNLGGQPIQLETC